MSTARRLLIVNADDYGLTDGIARGTLRAHRHGVLTSTSVLAVGPAARRTARWLADAPALGVGAHLALIGVDPPLLSRREIPTLVTGNGRFPRGWQRFLARAASGRVDPADVERELDAQVERLVGEFGLALTHLDTHQHLHLWPPVAEVTVTLAQRWRIGAVRVPSSRAAGPRGVGVRRLSAGVRRRLGEAGLVGPGAHAGLDEAGRLTLPALLAALDHLTTSGATSAEITCHPGEPDDAAAARRYEWGFARGAELSALTHPELRAAVDRLGWHLGTYADLAHVPPTGSRRTG